MTFMIDIAMFIFFIIMYYAMVHETTPPLEKIEHEIAVIDANIKSTESQLHQLQRKWGLMYNQKYKLQEEKNKILYPEVQYDQPDPDSDTGDDTDDNTDDDTDNA